MGSSSHAPTSAFLRLPQAEHSFRLTYRALHSPSNYRAPVSPHACVRDAGSVFSYVPFFFVAFAVKFYSAYAFWGLYGLKGKKRCAMIGEPIK